MSESDVGGLVDVSNSAPLSKRSFAETVICDSCRTEPDAAAARPHPRQNKQIKAKFSLKKGCDFVILDIFR
jgi:hypothetical protein